MGAGDFNVTRGGNWAVVGPHFKGKLPHGVIRVNSRYNRVWVVGRTYLRGPQDLRNLHRIQDEYSITPLSKFGTAYKPARPRKIITKSTDATIPGTQPGEDPLAFYAALGKEMPKFPAPAADRPLLAQLKTVGIGPGLDPAKAHLSADTLRGLRDAVTQGPNKVQAAALGALPPGVRHAQRLPDHRSRRVGHELHPARDRRQARRRRPAGEHRHLPSRAARRHQGAADRIEAVRGAHPQEQPADPGQGVLVADDVRHRLVLRPQPAQPLPSSTTGRICTPTPTARSTSTYSTTSRRTRRRRATGCPHPPPGSGSVSSGASTTSSTPCSVC